MAKRGHAKSGLLFHGQTSGITVMIPLERCEVTNKIKFDDQDAAERAAAEYALNNTFFATVYQCRHCSGYHLTKRGYSHLLS